ncbi:hypothetical protein [Aestuariimicrobium sp. T2.26MG-19.2B]|uniref:hypothetical protein n=1 Tax=Aestuariimicrobium sp. T2.26MG-19.2B TaxID=3040679 RepID=UPI002477BF71|nr:hypothetical protein [Aestuariimicrobium sp. T2.26MG-19.2B]CAI9400062.1 hypothetical protein AESSP_00316 [Aestuariimicrobium sp. T2.26MG-19.2B]
MSQAFGPGHGFGGAPGVRPVSTTTDRAASWLWMAFLAGAIVIALNLAGDISGRRWSEAFISVVVMLLLAVQAGLWRGARQATLAVSDGGLVRLAGGPFAAATGWQVSWAEVTHAQVFDTGAGPMLVVQVAHSPRRHLSRWWVTGVPRTIRRHSYCCQLEPAAVGTIRVLLQGHGIPEPVSA